MSDLPAGFELDGPSPSASAPDGFVVDHPSAWEDAGKSVAAGLASATAGTLGALGDERELMSAGVDLAGRKFGINPDKVQSFKNVVSAASNIIPGAALIANAPTSRDVINSAPDPIVSPDYQPQTTLGGYLKTGAEFAPALADPELLASPNALRAAGTIARRVVVPAVASETAGQLTKGTAAEPYARAAAAFVSPLAESAARRVITPLQTSPERQALVDNLAANGVHVTAGQATGNKPLQWMESALGDTIGSGAPAARITDNQAEQFTAAALRRAGINANRATPDVIDNAFTRIGNDFEGVAQRNNMRADPFLGHALTQVEDEYNNVVSPSNRAPVVENTIQDIGDMAAQNGGHLTGEQYNAITSRLARQARNARNDPQLQEALQGVRTSLDDAMERTLGTTGNTADMQVLRNARNQYRNMMVIEKAATGAGSNAAEGLISPSQLRNAVVQQSRRAYGRGQGDFADLARSGEALLKPLPQSGTSPRHNVTHLMETIGTIAGGAFGATHGPEGAIAGAAAGLAAPALAGRVLLSQPVQAYLRNRLIGPHPPGTNLTQRALALLSSTEEGRRLLAGNGGRPMPAPP